MSTGYSQPREQLRDEIGLARLRLARAISRRDPKVLPSGFATGLELDSAIDAAKETARIRARDAILPMPLDRLARVYGLTPSERDTLGFLVALELDTDLRELARFVTGDASRSEPDVGLLSAVLYEETSDLLADIRPDGPLFRYALATDLDAERRGAFVLRRVRASARVTELAHGIDRVDPDLAGIAELLEEQESMVDLDAQRAARAQVASLLTASIAATETPHPVVLMVGNEGAGRCAIVREAATAAGGYSVLRVRCDRVPKERNQQRGLGRLLLREAMWFGAVIYLHGVDEFPMEGRDDIDRALLGFVAGPLFASVPRAQAGAARFERGVVAVEVSQLEESDRARIWGVTLGTAVGPTVIDQVSARYTVSPGRIIAASRAALALANARDPSARSVTSRDVHEGLRAVLDARLSKLGTRLSWRQQWKDVVLPEDTLAEVRELIARVAHRKRVHDEWGYAERVAKGLGITALFTGPPGTGKTMVAGLIAEELALDVYQVDLSQVVSKWIGETEKNLAELFDAAEAGHAILLFDEADSLFAKRTDVSSSVDRYANLEVNYLLQRMERFAGISILTTNHDTAIDEAFRRRLSCRIEFALPESEERHRLWAGLLPDDVVGELLNIELLADRYVMSGGYIRNAVMRAAFLAADEGTRIKMKHLTRAANLEYAGFGKVMA